MGRSLYRTSPLSLTLISRYKCVKFDQSDDVIVDSGTLFLCKCTLPSPPVRGGDSQTEGGGLVLVPQEAQPTVPPLLQGLQRADPRGQTLDTVLYNESAAITISNLPFSFVQYCFDLTHRLNSLLCKFSKACIISFNFLLLCYFSKSWKWTTSTYSCKTSSTRPPT